MASKKKKERQQHEDAVRAAREMNTGKFVRLFGKSLVFALFTGLTVTVLSLAGLTWLENMWFQFALILAIYIVAYPYLMSEFRPNTYLRRWRSEAARAAKR